MANLLKRHEFWLGMFIIALCLLLGWRSEEFFTFGNLYDLANNYAMLTILACGLFVVLIAGGIDISFPAMTIIAQYGMVVMLQKVGGNFAVAFVLAGGIGVLLGLVNALLVNRLRVPSIIITISTLNIFYGLLLWLSKGVWLYDFPPWFEKGVMLFKYTDADGYDYGLGLPLLTMIAVVLLTAFIMNFTTVGRKIYAMGGNRESASRVGFSVLRLQLFVYGYMGLISGAAGVVQAWTVMTVAPDSLLGYELTVLAAVVLGGTSLIGGRGTLTLLTAYSEMGKGATWYAALAKRVLIPICKHLNTEKLCNKLNAISKEYPIDKSPYVGGFLWGYGPQEKMPKEFLEPVEVEFEGHMFPAPKCWDFYLTQLYGDYMQLPPENKRISHDFNVYMKENKE